MSKKKIYLLMVLTTLFWSGAFIAGKISGDTIPPFTLTFLRFLFATAILYPVLRIMKKNLKPLCKKDIPIYLFTGIIGMFGYHVFFFNSLRYTTPINSSIIGATNPIVTVLLSIVFLKDKLTFKKLIGIILSFTGVFLTITNANIEVIKNLSINKGDLLMLVAVLMWASYGVFSKKVMHRFDPYTLTFYSFLFCTIFCIPFVIYESSTFSIGNIPPKAYLGVLYMSIFPSVIGYLVQQLAIKEIGPSKTSIFINLVPVFSIILSVLILSTPLEPIKILTALIIITGVYTCQRA